MIAQNVLSEVKQLRKCLQKLITVWDVLLLICTSFKILVRDIFYRCMVSLVGRVPVCRAEDRRFKPWPDQPLGS